jgi:hypothetical protein
MVALGDAGPDGDGGRLACLGTQFLGGVRGVGAQLPMRIECAQQSALLG